MEKKRLGRGLDALLGGPAEGETAPLGSEIRLDQIHENPWQPRRFDQDELSALSAGVRTHGILQPLVVRQAADGYQLIAGERRLRAAREAGLATVPVRVVDFNDQQVLEAALVENIHRAGPQPDREGAGFRNTSSVSSMSHDQAGAAASVWPARRSPASSTCSN
ncbi:MAG: ParB/RepB/Spo0J family partition protein [Gemmataceae bacterium]